MKRNVMFQPPGMFCKHKVRHEKEAEKQQCYFCLEEENSVDFISCADTVKFRLSIQVSLAHLTAGAFFSGSFSPLLCWNSHFPPIRHRSEEHPSVTFLAMLSLHTAPCSAAAEWHPLPQPRRAPAAGWQAAGLQGCRGGAPRPGMAMLGLCWGARGKDATTSLAWALQGAPGAGQSVSPCSATASPG